jgi:hypothetical protein
MNEQIVWQSTLDGRYEVVVVRIAPYRRKLTIFDAGNTIFSQKVGLMYNAQFGPDVADVAEWQEIVVNFIDNKNP